MSSSRDLDAQRPSDRDQDDRSQPDIYLGYLLGWLTLIAIVVLGVFPFIDESWVNMLLIVLLLAAYVVTKYQFGIRGIFKA